MQELISSFLDNDSLFGRLMSRIGIVIGANLMFVVFSLPVITIGAAWTGLYHVMFKMLRGDGRINPFKQFWQGFRSNFRQATIVWVSALIAAVCFYFDFRITDLMEGGLSVVRYGLIGVAVIAVILILYLFPVMTAFADTLPHLARNSFFFALKSPFKLLVILFFQIFPLYLTYTDAQTMPLYGFLWVMGGYGAVALLTAVLLLDEFIPYLPAVDDAGNFITDAEGESSTNTKQTGYKKRKEISDQAARRRQLKEMKKLGM